MAVIINATTTTGLTTSADNSGVIQFQSNGANTVGISSTGYITVGGNQQIYGPSFSAYQSSAQTVSSSTWTKIQLQTEEWDTASCYNNSSTYRFTPTVAGYYQINGSVGPTGGTEGVCAIYKNGSLYKYGDVSSSVGLGLLTTVSIFAYLNGSTDYVELYVYLPTGSALNTGTGHTQFQASMVRGA